MPHAHLYAVNVPTPSVLDSVRVVDALIDSESLFVHLFGDSTAAFWLDAGEHAVEGWSILGTGRMDTDPRGPASVSLTQPSADDSLPFRGGWVGWLAYEPGAAALGAPTAAPHPVNRWIAVERAIAIDHASGALHALAGSDDLEQWAGEVTAAATAPTVAPPADAPEVAATARHGVGEYRDLVERCRQAIERGDAYQLCLTTRFTAPRPADPFTAYRRLRRATPAHHGGYLRVGDEYLLSASPEQFLHVSGGTVTTSPIKGTRPRGATVEQDAALAAELQRDVKERAENVMIVDLMRNDLSHVGVPGSVIVDRLWQVESYPAVHQLVSTVSARLRDGVSAGELWEATFPAGSMTGAPKLSAMTLLHDLEQAPRGVYSGCFGHIGLDGRVDLAMIIRSIVIDEHEAYVGAGGGITWLSQPQAEAAEVATKARAPLRAIGATLPVEWAALSE